MSRACICVLALLALSAIACNAQLGDAIAAHDKGEYSQAIGIYRRAVERDPADVAARKGLARALMETGQYSEAEQILRAAPQNLAATVANMLGDALAQQGRTGDAEAAYRAARTGADSLTARLNLAILQYSRGNRAAALNEFDSFIDVYNKGPKLSSEELTAVATAVRYLGERDPQLYKDALGAFDEAIAADGRNDEARLRVAELFLDKYNGTEAQKGYAEILARNPKHARALLGMARAKEFEGSAESIELAQKALETNPNLVDAHILIARAYLSSEDYKSARTAAEKALAINPVSLKARSILAAAQLLSGDRAAFEQTRGQIAAVNPRYADLFITLAEQSAQTRQYARAIDYARQATALDSTSWAAHGLVGINLMRVGQIKDGRAALEVAFKGDPYNVWFKNTLDLLDTMDRFQEVEQGRFRIAIDPREADLLTPYVAGLADEAYTRMSQRYKTQLSGPVRIELFNSHADFSVRTVGLAGLGALGAAFGNVLVMDSPSAREAGAFNWGATLWHELAHAFHMALSDHRVPRWLTEGLASLEERRSRTGWGEEIAPGFIQAYKQEKLLPVSQLNRGFVRPEYPEQVGYSYYQASLVAEMIEKDYGFDAILGMLKAYGAGQSNEQVFRSVLKTEPEAFDKKYEEYFKQRFARQIAAVRATNPKAAEIMQVDMGDYASALLVATNAAREKKYDQAIELLKRAKEMYPDYGGPNSPYEQLAAIYHEQGDTQKALAELEQLTARNENNFEANMLLADIAQKANNAQAAAAALDRAIYIYPMQPLLHQRLAELYTTLGNKQNVVRERRALVALKPVDKAEAHYQLALAYFDVGDQENARREVLRALEEAPNFEKAQALLLRLRGS